MRVVFWGNSHSLFSGRHFVALLAAPCDLVGVVDFVPKKQGSTNPLPHGVPNFVYAAHRSNVPVFSPANPNKADFIRDLTVLEPDLFIAVGYTQILKRTLLAVPKSLSANFHASLLPKYRGKHPVFQTLRGSERWAGLTVHYMDTGIDTGDIIYQVRVRTRLDDTVASLYDRIIDRSALLVNRLLNDLRMGILPRRRQPTLHESYFSSIQEEDYRLDWTWSSKKIRRYILMTPWKCFIDVRAKHLFLARAGKVLVSTNEMPGTILAIGRKRCTVATGDGAVWLGQARNTAGEERSMAEHCRQMGIGVGDRFI